MKTTILILLILLGKLTYSQSKVIIVGDSAFIVKDTCCTYDEKPDSNYAGFYVLNFSDTTYFSNVSVITECIDNMTTILGNSLSYCHYISSGVPISGNFQICYKQDNHIVKTFYGHLKQGYYWNGIIINYYSDSLDISTAKIQSTGQISNGWISGIYTMYYENGRIETIERYISGIGGPVYGYDFDEKGNQVGFYDDTEHFEQELEKERIINGY
jgi:hypothetical protein